jgi:hypothetical protein
MSNFPIFPNNATIDFRELFVRHTVLVRNDCGSGLLFNGLVVNLVVVTFFLFGGEERTDDFDDMGLSEMFVLGWDGRKCFWIEAGSSFVCAITNPL